MNIINAAIVMTMIGFLAGSIPALASKLFYIVEDPRLEAVKSVLPGINCGGCGFVGCEDAARAVISGQAPVNVCIVGGFEVASRVAQILGLKTTCDGTETVLVECTGGRRAETRFYYNGVNQCKAEFLFFSGSNICEKGCLGHGSCVSACPFEAIHMNADHFPEIDESRCRVCGKCVEACPTGVLSIVGFTGKLLHLNQENDCLAPCRQKCPAQVDVPHMIRYIRDKDYQGALLKIKERNPLVLTTGRVCRHKCENICRRNIADQGVAICQLLQFVGEQEINSGKHIFVNCSPETGTRVAIVGGGPSGLSCAYFLRRLGHQPIIFEKKPELGGMLRYGIPEYRLPNRIVDWDIKGIIKLGVEVKTNRTFGLDFTLNDLISVGYDAVFLGLGAWIVPSLCIEGENTKEVISSLDFLSSIGSSINDLTGSIVVVVGESNTAMDCARSCIRLNAKSVTVICPTEQKEMSARKNDVTRAMEEGVIINFLTLPTRILSDESGKVSYIEYCHLEPVKNKGSNGRKRIPGSNQKIDSTLIISAYERKPDIYDLLHDQKEGYNFKASRHWTIEADKNTLLASNPNTFTAGDAYTGRSSVISAVAGGRIAARSIHFLLSKGIIPISSNIQKRINPKSLLRKVHISRHIPKAAVQELPVSIRKNSFAEEVQGTISEEQALLEARRCLRCGTTCYDR